LPFKARYAAMFKADVVLATPPVWLQNYFEKNIAYDFYKVKGS
jgi:hypothetical protein